MNTLFAGWSDNFVYAATAVIALAFLAHAAEWAFARERRTAAQTQTSEQEAREVALTAARSVATDDAATIGSGAARGMAGSGTKDAHGTGVGSAAGEGTAGAPPAGGNRGAVYGRIGISLTILATSLLGLGVLFRGLAAGRVPWSNMYEFATTGIFVVAVVYLALLSKYRLTWLGLPLTGFTLVILGVSVVLLYTPVAGLIPALQSYWLAIHVSAAVLATGVFSVAALASVLQLVRARYERRVIAGAVPAGQGYLARFPSAEAIDRLAYRLHAFAFPVWTFALIAGAIWAEHAWGRFWGWDPKETWMFISWVVYAAYLHARSTAGWRNRASWIALVAYLTLLFNLVGVNLLFSGMHSYAGV